MKQKIVYLTIDDAPSKDFKKKVNFLIKKKIPAIIFIEGQHLKGREKEIIYAIKKGFHIGNHAYNHPHFSKIDLPECIEEIKKTDEIIEKLYKKSKIKRPLKIFRFPYGDKGRKNKKEIQKYLRTLGYKQPKFERINYSWYKIGKVDKDLDVFWTINIREYQIGKKKYKENTIQEILNLINRSKELKSNSRDIILIHDHDDTTKYFNLLIETLLKKGIKFVEPILK